jgi:hypothetical protein
MNAARALRVAVYVSFWLSTKKPGTGARTQILASDKCFNHGEICSNGDEGFVAGRRNDVHRIGTLWKSLFPQGGIAWLSFMQIG